MPVDRVLFTAWFNEKESPNWPCMTCRGGHLRLQPQSLKHLYTAASIEASKHEAHDYDWDLMRAVALVMCDNPRCKESATIAAEGKWVEDHDWARQELNYAAVYTPVHFQPSPPLIDIPDGCPDQTRKAIELAFVSSWGDQASAANHIRTAIERLLDARRVSKTQPKSKRRLALHDRIERLRASQPDAYAALMAIKWLGNAGSHTDDLTRDDIFNAFDILELALRELYVGHDKRIGRLIATINARKGPTRVRRKVSSADALD